MIRGHQDGWSQAKERRYQRMIDQHGRRWGADVEIKSGYPTGLIRPEFSAPFLPDQKYLTMNPEDMQDLQIDYERMLRDRREAHETYRREIARVCNVRGWDVPEDGAELPFQVTEIVGPPPEPVEPVLAAMQGNSYVLGLTTRVDPRLAHYFAPNVDELPDFTDQPDNSDVEEAHDPAATGGTRENLSRGKRGAERRGRRAVQQGAGQVTPEAA